MKYDAYQYLFPPRPETKIPPSALGSAIYKGWWAQVKKNGTCTMIFVRGKEVIFKTRHPNDFNGNHKQWTPTKEIIEFFQNDSDKWNVYVAELLHNKTKHIKDQLYIFDQIVEDGVHLVHSTFEERQAKLANRWPRIEEVDQYRVSPHVSVAKNYSAGFPGIFERLKPEDEGLVLKDPKGKLRSCLTGDSNYGWQVKSRIPHKNYGF